MSVFIGIVVATVLVLVLAGMKVRRDDQRLDQALSSLHEEAEIKLSPAAMTRLNDYIAEVAELGRTTVKAGVRPQQASRFAKREAINRIAYYLELARLQPEEYSSGRTVT